jgi:Bifunctional DNA primase/polymerase, N-terminal
MSGLFAAWQPRYAQHGIPTFPVRFDGADKRPGIRGWQKVGTVGSHQLALKFPDADAMGFVLGRRSGIVVLDVDTTCERERDAAFFRHGEPAIVVRSISGHWQGWYRHSGERRLVRPWGPARPIDVLGNGYVVAPPSRGPCGRYEFVQGGLDDLHRIEPLRNIELPTTPAPFTLVGEGKRHTTLVRFCQEQVRFCDDKATLIDVARTYAESTFDMIGNTHPYTEAQIVNAASWAWALEAAGLNLVGRGGATVLRHDVIDKLAARDPDGYALYSILWRHHSDRHEFVMANAMADNALCWTMRRFKAAQARLCEKGLIERVHRGGRWPGDPPRYRWKGL